MRYFLDTEFLEAGPDRPLRLVSLGLVAEDDREYYAIDARCPIEEANAWVAAHVLPQLDWRAARPREVIREEVLRFVAGEARPEFWGYYADYDWVVFAQLFGTLVDLPRHFPKYCRDVKQWADALGNPRLPPKPAAEHHALADARWIRQAWQALAELEAERVG